MGPPVDSTPVNWAVYRSLPPTEAQYQLDHLADSRVKDIVVSHVACLAIAVVAIALRFISRRMVRTPIKADDWMIVAALIFAIGYIVSVLLCILEYGGGRHAILLKDPIKFAQSVLAAEVFYSPAIASVKISTLLLFTRIFPGRQFRVLLWTVGTFVATYSAILVLAAIFQCQPLRGAWDTTVKAKCIKINLCWMILAGMNVLTDFILLCAPLPTLWALQISKGMRWQLIGIFCVGGFVCIISIYRIPKLYGLSLVDASWSNADPTIWSLVEVCVAIACACAIVYRPLFNWVFRIHISAPNSEGSRKISRPSAGGGGAGSEEWGSKSGHAIRLQRVASLSSQSRLRSGDHGGFQPLEGAEDAFTGWAGGPGEGEAKV